MSGGESQVCESNMCKGFLDLNFNEVVIDKISIFCQISPNFTYSQK